MRLSNLKTVFDRVLQDYRIYTDGNGNAYAPSAARWVNQSPAAEFTPRNQPQGSGLSPIDHAIIIGSSIAAAGAITFLTGGSGAGAGVSLVSWAIGGATAGAVSGASYAYANGGDTGQVLRGAAFGALSGAVGGAVGNAVFGSLGGGFVGYTLSGAAGGSAAGFIEGFAATGTWNGAFQGALYGGIAGAGFGIVAYGAVRGIGYIGGVRSANLSITHNSRVRSMGSKPASSVNASAALGKKLSALEDFQSKAVRTRMLPDGRIRYYDVERVARTPGPTRGNAMVLEWNPSTGRVRMWAESYDHAGSVARVHPKMINGQDVIAPHYPPTGKELGQ